MEKNSIFSQLRRMSLLFMVMVFVPAVAFKLQAQTEVEVDYFADLEIAIAGTADVIKITDDFEIEGTLHVLPLRTVKIISGTGGPYTLTRKFNFGGYLFDVQATATLTLENITIDGETVNPNTTESLITNSGILNLNEGATLQNNNEGGAILNHKELYIKPGSLIIDNRSSSYGGGISNNINSVVTMDGGEIMSNNSKYGGGVSNFGTFTISGGSIKENSANASGGGIFNAGTFTMSGGSIEENSAKGIGIEEGGGGIYNDSGGNVTMSGGSIIGNSAELDGGGVFNKGTFTMNHDNASISENTAIGSGGGVYNYVTSFEISGGYITKNTAANGKGLYWKTGSVTVSGTAHIGSSSDDNAITRTANTQLIQLAAGGLTTGAYINISSLGADVYGTFIANAGSAADAAYSVGYIHYLGDFNMATNGTGIFLNQADLAIIITTPYRIPAVGETAVFTITVTNNGPGDAENVTIDLTNYASKLTSLEYRIGGGSFAPCSGNFNIGAMTGGGGSIIVSLQATVTSNTQTTITASVSSDASDPAPTNNAAFVILLDPSAYGLIFNVSSGEFWVDINNNGTIDLPDIQYPLNSKWSYSGGNLTLNGFEWITSASIALQIIGSGSLTVTLNGTNRFESTNSTLGTYGIYTVLSLTFTGTGTLQAKAANTAGSGSVGIISIKDITVDGGTIEATAGSAGTFPPQSVGIWTSSSNFIINNGTVHATAGDAIGGFTYGVYAQGGYISINNGTVNAKAGYGGSSYGLFATNGVTINGGTVKAEADISVGYGISYCIINGGTVTAQAFNPFINTGLTIIPGYRYWTNGSAGPSGAVEGTPPYIYNFNNRYVKVEAVYPTAPQTFSASATGIGKITITWAAPATDGGSAITKYQYSAVAGGGADNWQDIPGAGGATSYDITGLSDNSQYTVKIRAVNGSGAGFEATATATTLNPAGYGLLFDATNGVMYYDINNNGTPVAGNEYPSGATWSFSGGVLTLNNLSWTTSAPTALWIVGNDLEINLTAGSVNNFTSTISAYTAGESRGIYFPSAKLTITGTGTLIAKGGSTAGQFSMGINCFSGLTVNNGTIQATGGATTGDNAQSSGIISNNSITVNNGTIHATGGATTNNNCSSSGIFSGLTITVNDGTIHATGGATSGSGSYSNGIDCDNIEVYGGIINATGGATTGLMSNSYGIIVGTMKVAGGITHATGGSVSTGNISYGVDEYSLTMDDGELNATGITTSGTGYGVSGTILDMAKGALTASGSTLAIDYITINTLPTAYIYRRNTAANPAGATEAAYVTGSPTHNIPFTNQPTDLYVQIVSGIDYPTAPTGLTATAGDGQVTLSWTAPADNGGGTITGYEVSSDNGVTWSAAASPTGHTFAGLTNGVSYTFKVRAINILGGGAEATVTATPAAPPTYVVTVVDSYAPAAGTGSYQQSAIVSIDAGARSGYTFSGWTTASPGVTFANAANTATTFAMPANDVTVTAGWTLDAPPTSYAITIAPTTGGVVSADRMSAFPGETVTLTIISDAGYELASLIIDGRDARPCVSTSGDCTFTMPANDVTIEATFQKMGYQSQWAAALKLIEEADFSFLQSEAPGADDLRFRLADFINELIKTTGFIVSPYDIVVFTFVPASAGTSGTPSGVNGKFEFRVTPPYTYTSAYNDGIITATAFDATGNDPVETHGRASLHAWTQNGILYVDGLTPGTTWRVYTLTGTLIYTGNVETHGRASLPDQTHGRASLPVKGIYIVTNGTNAVKVVY